MGKKLPNSINLLETISPPGDTFTIFYEWVFTIGKYLLIFVQVIVIVLFLMRLSVDRINNDLTADINNQVELLKQEEFRDNELKYRNLQSLLRDIENLTNNHIRNSQRVVTALDGIPEDIILEEFSFSNNNVTASFLAETLADVQGYETFLKQSPGYSNVSLELEKRGSDEMDVDFTVNYFILLEEDEY